MQGKWHNTYGCFPVAIGAQKSIDVLPPVGELRNWHTGH
jgi:hypothetical protein